jgi:type I restriction enzyme S subunit
VSNWKQARIGDLCEIIKGETGLASAPPGEYPLVATGADRRSCTTWQFDTDAVCIPLVSSTGHGKKTLNYVHYQSGKFALGTILAAVIPKDPSVLTARFLHLYLSHFKDTVLVPLMKGAANVSLSMKDIASVEIPVPPLDEQQSLINLIFRIEDEHRELLTEINHQEALLKQLRQAVIQESVEGKLTEEWRNQHPVVKGDPQHDAVALLAQIKSEREQLVKEGKIRKEKPLPPITGEEKPFDLPRGWVWCRTSEICSDIVDCPHSTPQYIEYGANCIDTTCFDDSGEIKKVRYVSPQTFVERNIRLVPVGGDVIYSREGIIGQAVVLPENSKFCLGQRVMLFRSETIVLSPLFRLLVVSPEFRERMTKNHKGMGAKHLNMFELRNAFVPLPPIAEQQAIVTHVNSLKAIIDELEKQVTERKEQAQILMQTVLREAFAGSAVDGN